MATQSATLRYLHIAPRKVRAVAGLLRGLSVNEAEAQLLLQPKRAAKPLLKLLRSAVANAKQTKQLASEGLVVARIAVDQGPMLKRMLPRARGSASPIQKKMSHITIVLAEAPASPKNRFTIVSAKKVKVEKPKKKTAEKIKAASEASKRADERKLKERERPGFFKRVFRRKSV